jgi:molybdopterin molybdotransferase
MLSLEEAQANILGAVTQFPPEPLPLEQAMGRFVTSEIRAQVDLPPFDNSAMDGYAVRVDDLVRASATNPIALQLLGETPAGKLFKGELKPQSCVRIFTGSPLPKGSDAVVMQEDVKIDEANPGQIVFSEAAKPWENIRLRGEDIKTGAILASKGQRLTPMKLALLAACGIPQVELTRKPVIGIFATGDELCELGAEIEPGQIYESNRLLLSGLVESTGCAARIYPIISDSMAATRKMFKQVLAESDAVITTGGVSVGEYDFVKAAFEKAGGTLDLWRVALRPGKPFVFGRFKKKFLFGLPGNPVSTVVTFLLLVRPALLKMLGAAEVHSPSIVGVLAQPLVNRTDRRHFMRVRLATDGHVHSAGVQASHMLSSLGNANGLVEVPAETRLETGTKVKVLLWDLPMEARA